MQVKKETIAKTLLFIMVISILLWGWRAGTFQYISNHFSELLILTGQHFKMVGLSVFFAIAIAIPTGCLVTRPKFKKLELPTINFANILMTIPTLALLALGLSFLGLGYKTAVVALWAHSLLPILRNTIAGINSIDTVIVDAGKGMGLSQFQLLTKLEIPNAMYAILAGVRTAIVPNVGAAAIASLIGAGGLGDWIFTGISILDAGIMLAGSIPLIIFALTLDFGLGQVEKYITPRGITKQLENY